MLLLKLYPKGLTSWDITTILKDTFEPYIFLTFYVFYTDVSQALQQLLQENRFRKEGNLFFAVWEIIPDFWTFSKISFWRSLRCLACSCSIDVTWNKRNSIFTLQLNTRHYTFHNKKKAICINIIIYLIHFNTNSFTIPIKKLKDDIGYQRVIKKINYSFCTTEIFMLEKYRAFQLKLIPFHPLRNKLVWWEQAISTFLDTFY